MSEELKLLCSRFIEETWNRHDAAAMDRFVSPNFVDHSRARDVPGVERFKQLAEAFFTAFPDIHFAIEDVFAEGDQAVVRWTMHGTHKGVLRRIPPTDRRVVITGINIYRFAGGQLVERWGNFDELGLMQQLGVIPT